MPVIAEAKRGKSTFVNTPSGRRDLLPTDVEVATSQVYDIRTSGREVYPVTLWGRLRARDWLEELYSLRAKHTRGPRSLRWYRLGFGPSLVGL